MSAEKCGVGIIILHTTYVDVKDQIPEMSEGEHSDVGVIMFALGFTVMMILDVALG